MQLLTSLAARFWIRGNPTVECDVLLESGTMGRGRSCQRRLHGSREAIELRDGDKNATWARA